MAFDKNLMKGLFKLDGYVSREYDPYQHIIEPSSPSLAYTFDNTWGLPQGYTFLLWGEQKGGKSLIARMLCGDLHKQDPDAVALYYNTEMREELQATPASLQSFGIDLDRYAAYNTNRPGEIFNPIEQEVPKLIKDGLKVRLIVIDSVTDILGRKMEASKDVDDFLIGDNAATVGDGLNRIKSTLRRYNIACVLVAQARAEMDKLEKMRGNDIKMAAAWAVKHKAEFFMKVEHLRTAEGKKDLLGNALIDTTIQNVMSSAKDAQEGDVVGRKMRCTMQASSCGRDGRVGIFTLHKDRGLINTHEEVFLLGAGNFGVIEEPSQGRFKFGERTWHGKEAILKALEEDTQLRKDVLVACKRIDLARRTVDPVTVTTA
jgi:RecA/RadA recombinase